MTTTAIRKKVHQYVDSIEPNLLEAVYAMLKIYIDDDGQSLMNTEQKADVDERAKEYRQGKTGASSWEDVKKRTQASYRK